jgi:hypothetical protein
MPAGITHELEDALSAVQTWAGQQEGNGKWIDAVVDGAGLNGYLRIDGSGNSWTIGAVGPINSIAYTLVGNTMVLSIQIYNTTLALGAGETGVYLLIPDGYAAAGRPVANVGYMIDNATATTCRILANPRSPINRYLRIERIGAILAAASDFTINGQITFEVARS